MYDITMSLKVFCYTSFEDNDYLIHVAKIDDVLWFRDDDIFSFLDHNLTCVNSCDRSTNGELFIEPKFIFEDIDQKYINEAGLRCLISHKQHEHDLQNECAMLLSWLEDDVKHNFEDDIITQPINKWIELMKECSLNANDKKFLKEFAKKQLTKLL
jgi:hypothetical protein